MLSAVASTATATANAPIMSVANSPMASSLSSPPSHSASAHSSPTITSIRRRRRHFITNIFQYVAWIYDYICTLFHMQQQQQQHQLLQQQQQQQQLCAEPTKRHPPPTPTTMALQPLPLKKHTPLGFMTPSKQSIPQNAKTLQYYKGKTLVLDLDETLVHSVRLGSVDAKAPVSTSIKRKKIEVTDDKQSLLYVVYKRPHVDFFLKTISQWYKVVIYTASMAEYADPVIDWLDEDRTLISQRYFRQSCVFHNGNFLKNISLAEPDLAKVCLVDNSPAAFGLCEDNAIPLTSWISNPNDECLLDLLPFLDALRFTADVRSILRLRHAGASKSTTAN